LNVRSFVSQIRGGGFSKSSLIEGLVINTSMDQTGDVLKISTITRSFILRIRSTNQEVICHIDKIDTNSNFKATIASDSHAEFTEISIGRHNNQAEIIRPGDQVVVRASKRGGDYYHVHYISRRGQYKTAENSAEFAYQQFVDGTYQVVSTEYIRPYFYAVCLDDFCYYQIRDKSGFKFTPGTTISCLSFKWDIIFRPHGLDIAVDGAAKSDTGSEVGDMNSLIESFDLDMLGGSEEDQDDGVVNKRQAGGAQTQTPQLPLTAQQQQQILKTTGKHQDVRRRNTQPYGNQRKTIDQTQGFDNAHTFNSRNVQQTA